MYATVIKKTNLDFCPANTIMPLEKCVALVFGGIHALNVVSVVSGKVIFVEDLSSSPTPYNPITENFVHSIFPFN